VTPRCGAGAVGVSIGVMIKHVVMWKLRGTSLEEKREQALRVRVALEGLRGVIPGMSSLEVGVRPAADEQLADVVLISTHDDWAALKAYQVHPAHVEVARVIGAVRIERRVLDFEVGSDDSRPPDSMPPLPSRP
jgi:Stress responsive A/B Barrel Domain